MKLTTRFSLLILLISFLEGCVPHITPKELNKDVPATFRTSTDQVEVPRIKWRDYFHDENLCSLIDLALTNNQELKIFTQELEIARNEVGARSGAYLPFVDLGAGAGFDKVGRYTRNGALEANTKIEPGKEFPEPLQNFLVGARASWEIDIWRKLRNSEKAALMRFIASQEGRNFLVTNLIAEIANTYYELRALDSQLKLVKQNISIQSNALKTIRLEKESARVTELAVRRFEAQVLKTQSLQYEIQQKIFETENKLNFLAGRFPQTVQRDQTTLTVTIPELVKVGIPSQLLQNRPDIRKAEIEVAAAQLDIEVAKAVFYPSLNLSAEIGLEAYRLGNVLKTPESLLYNLAGNIAGPLINRRAITADFLSANAKQIQAVFNYERAILNGFIEASNQISNVKNLEESYNLRSEQVNALTDSISIAGTLFTSARADYTEVLLTQRDALESRFELIDTKVRQMQAFVTLYRALGGGWD